MFTGIIPTEIGKLNKLKILTIENNNIYGAIPSELGLLNILQVLKLGECNFNDTKLCFVTIYSLTFLFFALYHCMLIQQEIML